MNREPVEKGSIGTFGAAPLEIGQKLYLTDASEKLENSKLNIELYEHQKTAVAALLRIERERVFATAPVLRGMSNAQYTVGTNAAILSERVGAGKTFIILELISQSQRPRALATKVVLTQPPMQSHSKDDNRIRDNLEAKADISIQYTGPNALLHPNLIIVGASVVDQWERNIRQHTNMKVFVIRGQPDMKKFTQLFRSNDLRQFHIVLLKNGKYTGDLEIGDGKECGGLIYAMNEITKGHCWSRVIYDDFDTINIVPGSNAVNALFSIYVSATERKEAPIIRREKPVEYKNLAEILTASHRSLQYTVHDRVLFTNFNIRNAKDFVDLSAQVTVLEVYRYIYDNPDDNFIQAIGALGADEARETVEALNAGAYSTAAQRWGCESRSPADIFKKMLDKQYDLYMSDVKTLEIIEKVRANVMELDPYPEEKRFKVKVLDIVRTAVAKKTIPEVKYFDDRIIGCIDELKVEYTRSKDRNGISINRVIDNVKQGDCQACCIPLEETNVFIVRCCGLIVCDVCGIKGNQIALRYNYKIKGHTVCGQCSNCKAEILPQRDLIFVDRNFDMMSLLKAKGDEKPLDAIVEEVKPENPDEPKIRNPKLRTLLKIIKGEPVAEREKIPNKIKNLIEGVLDRPQPAGVTRKLLLFAGFDETLNTIEGFLIEHNIEFLRLNGSSQQVTQTVLDFKKRGTVLLINSKQKCAGLDLQFATDLVYFHVISDEHVESQVAGRIQRLNRQFNGRIHYLMFRNEKK